ncbi:endosomal integral membrane protein [Strigomonas culicis]|uniref:Transmembrane 9 superfamily member n=2 Tax=Strigomonas culicis TaxID=28005 RepID=S9VJZ7_9TRYP|nr:endosomal integral membrane protein [Strigomonas culicis]|eukprot:EPY27416.1 endosomal integral membrane protein [Strigomonas culicis]
MRPRSPIVFVYVAVLFLLVGAGSTCLVSGGFFYIPGAQATYYKRADQVSVNVNALRSASYTYPLDYYSLPFCAPASIQAKSESLGEIIWGDRIFNSLYMANMRVNRLYHITEQCDDATVIKKLYDEDKKGLKKLMAAINRGYRGFMNIDNLPVFVDVNAIKQKVTCNETKTSEKIKNTVYGSLRGFPLGVPKSCTGSTILYNHLHFTVNYNAKSGKVTDADDEEYMVVGFKVVPYSILWTEQFLKEKLEEHTGSSFDPTTIGLPIINMETNMETEKSTIFWTYSVDWVPSNVLWASRWDEYFRSSTAGKNAALHYTYACASIIIVLLVASIAVSVLLRALHKDFNRYNAADPEDLQEETGWKLIHADVFRPPNRATSLAVLAGNGYQILGMCGGVFVLAVLGFLSPSRRGSLMTAVLVLFVVMSIVSGYVCGFFLQYFGQRSWRPVFLCSCAFPGSIGGTYLFFNIVSRVKHSTAAAPVTTILLLLALWVFASVPLTLLGASVSFGQSRPPDPVRVGRLAREIPKQYGPNSRWFLYLVPPLFPLATIITELYFVMQGLWAGAIFYAFGFLTFVGLMWAIVCALVAVSQVYYVLCYENHRWWWYAFIVPGGMGLHMFGFSVIFFIKQLQITSFISALLYFSYMGLISFGYGVAAGAIGLSACLLFVRAIYASIKVD